MLRLLSEFGKEVAEYAAVHDGRIVGPCSVTRTRGVGVVAATAACGGVVVDHRVHGSGRDSEKEPWRAKLAEVTQIILPVGLRHYGHSVACRLKRAAYYRGPK